MFNVPGLRVDQFVYGSEGSTVLLSCGLGGVEKWVKDNQYPLPSYNGKVWLHNVSHTHQGDYTCSYQKQTFNYYLLVQG